MQYEPTRIEILLTKLAFILYKNSVYKAFSDCLPLVGSEQVLDFGCGMGSVAYHTSRLLTKGSLTCLDISGRWLNCCRKTLRGSRNVTFLRAEAPSLPKDSFDVVYCHFVLHDISESELERVIPALVRSIKSGGAFIFREPLSESQKLNIIKRLVNDSNLYLKDSRITDVPLLGNTLESIYIK